MRKLIRRMNRHTKMEHADYVVGAVSHQGNVRDRNEDAYACPNACEAASGWGYLYEPPDGEPDRIFVVADGVGGSDEGRDASRLAVTTVVDRYYGEASDTPAERLEQAVVAANRAVVAYGEEMEATASTTLTALLVHGPKGIIAHAGDSRLYRIRDGEIVQLTQDHDLVGEFVRSGALTPEEAAVSDLRSVITRGIGSEPDVTPDVSEIEPAPEDAFLLCSDGLTRHVHDEEIRRIVQETRDPQRAAKALVDLALRRGGKDNVTVLVVRPRRDARPNPLFTIIQVLALAVLLAGLLWSVYVVSRDVPDGGADTILSPVATSVLP